MKLKNRVTMERAIGMIEGVAWVSGVKQIDDALITAVEMLDTVLKDEENQNE